MVKLEDAVIARYEHSGHKFELLVDPNLAMDLKNGGIVEFSDFSDDGAYIEAWDLVSSTINFDTIK